MSPDQTHAVQTILILRRSFGITINIALLAASWTGVSVENSHYPDTAADIILLCWYS